MDNECSLTYSRLHPVGQQIGAVMFLAVLAVFLAIAFLISSFASALQIPFTLAFASLLFIALPFFLSWAIEIFLMLDSFRFSLQQECVFVRRGAISPTYDVVPYENVQDAQVSQGPIQRMVGAATIIVSTPASSVIIPNAMLNDAQDFKNELLALAKIHKGMAE